MVRTASRDAPPVRPCGRRDHAGCPESGQPDPIPNLIGRAVAEIEGVRAFSPEIVHRLLALRTAILGASFRAPVLATSAPGEGCDPSLGSRLVEADCPDWRISGLLAIDGVWFCAVRRERPGESGTEAHGSHPDPSLAILLAYLAALSSDRPA